MIKTLEEYPFMLHVMYDEENSFACLPHKPHVDVHGESLE